MKSLLTHRALLVWLAPAIALALFYLFDPDDGAQVKVWLVMMARAFVIVAFAHWVRKSWFPYVDLADLVERAKASATGAGLSVLAIAVFIFAVLMLFAGQAKAQDVRTVIPPQAAPYLPMLREERARVWPDHPEPGMLAALVEHESGCPSMPKKCWNPRSQLHTAREEGAGFGQITRAFRPDGSERFDALADLRARHPAELAGWSWANVYERPELQLRALALMSRDNFRALAGVPDPAERLRFADAAYNGGLAGVQRERMICKQVAGCDPGRWYGHVEAHCGKSTAPLYGTRSACDINRHHVRDVDARTPKYRGLV